MKFHNSYHTTTYLYPTGQTRQYPHNQLQWRLTVPSRKYAYLQHIEERWKLILFQLLIHHQKALTQFKYQVRRLLRNPGRKKLSKSRVEIRSRQSQRGQLQHVAVHRLPLISSKGLSINDVTPKGEGGGTPKRWHGVTGGRDPIFSRGDVTPKAKISPREWGELFFSGELFFQSQKG